MPMDTQASHSDMAIPAIRPDAVSVTGHARRGIPGEIGARLRGMRETARERGEVLLPPLLMLGTSERVGSNWISDTLRPVLGQHNEPFRQQLGADHPLSPLNSRLGGLSGGLPALGSLGRHLLVTFAASKYGTTRQAVKETNLFFALPAFLALLPDAPVLVLSRSPLGVASSFERSGLFRRWEYRARYRQMITMTRNGNSAMRRFRPLVPDDGPPDLMALVRLQVLNSVLLAEALTGRSLSHIPYETAVIAPDATLGTLTAAVPELAAHGLCLDQAGAPEGPGAGDDTFSTTTAKTGLIAHLDPAGAELIRATTAASLAAAQDVAPPPVIAQAATWLAGDHLYRLQPLRPSPAAAKPLPSRPAPAVAPRYVRRGGLEVRNLLVSNAEYAQFLNAMTQAGMPNSHGGTYLLACEMPHERGGRLHHDPATGRCHVSPGYGDHPAYWVTWIGAAAFAAWHGARLPTRPELIELTSRISATACNAAYRFGDVTPVTEPGHPPGDIHHLLGNVQAWCADGPPAGQLPGGPAGRWLYGTAWNTPATEEEARRPRHRHILGCSRGVGIRLVRDGAQRPVSVGELADRLAAWIAILADRSWPVSELDEWLIRALDASQADAGLGPHIAPGAGEARHG
jgi:hypothetical protein